MADMFKAFTKKLGEWWRAEGEKQPDVELWPLHGIPKEYSRKAEPRGSIYQAPLEVDVTGVGQIKQAGGLAKALRKIMQAEMKARGPVPSTKPRIHEQVLRGTYYHGRGKYPKSEQLLSQPFKEVRSRSGQLGEPSGISLTYKPEVATKFSKVVDPEAMKEYKFIKENNPVGYSSFPQEKWKVFDPKGKHVSIYFSDATLMEIKQNLAKMHKVGPTKIARVMPLFGGPPEKNILKVWDPEAGKVLKQTYTEAFKQLAREDDTMLVWVRDYESFKNHLQDTPKLWDTFNSKIRDILQSKGYKGILYSPHRYGEYELRMFDPKDVLMLEERGLKDPGVMRALGTEKAPGPVREKATRHAVLLRDKVGSSLRDWYEQIDFPGLIEKTRKELGR